MKYLNTHALTRLPVALLSFPMQGVFPIEAAVFHEFEFFRRFLFIFGRGIIPTFALGTRQGDNFTHNPPSYLSVSVFKH